MATAPRQTTAAAAARAPAARAGRRAVLDGAEQTVHHQGQYGRGDRPGQDEAGVHGRDAAVDVGAEAARADGRGDGGRSHGHDRGDPHPGQDHRQGQGQLDAPQSLAVGHPEAGRRLHHRRIDLGDAGDGVAENGEQSIGHEGDECRPCADPADGGKGNQEAEQGQAREWSGRGWPGRARGEQAAAFARAGGRAAGRGRPRWPSRPGPAPRAGRPGRGAPRAFPRRKRQAPSCERRVEERPHERRLGVAADLVGRSDLDHAARVHHRQPVGRGEAPRARRG